MDQLKIRGMKVKTRTAKVGRVPGSGKWQQEIVRRPDEPSLVSRLELATLVGVSNRAVISKVLEKLAIAPVVDGSKALRTYNNGGFGHRTFDVPYFDEAVVSRIRAELQLNSLPWKRGTFRYAGQTFSWK